MSALNCVYFRGAEASSRKAQEVIQAIIKQTTVKKNVQTALMGVPKKYGVHSVKTGINTHLKTSYKI